MSDDAKTWHEPQETTPIVQTTYKGYLLNVTIQAWHQMLSRGSKRKKNEVWIVSSTDFYASKGFLSLKQNQRIITFACTNVVLMPPPPTQVVHNPYHRHIDSGHLY